MNVSKYTSELLFDHDCVIIPDLGGLVCNPARAEIHPGKHLFQPPYKKISFNRNLKLNDGLLANHISRVLGITYAESCLKIKEEVQQIQGQLSAGQSVSLSGIGILHPGSEGTIHFEQDLSYNYLAESLGLTAFHATPIKREALERKIERQLKDRVVPGPASPVVRRIPARRIMAIAASLVLFVSMALISFNQDWVKNTHMAGWNPFYETPEALYHPDPEAQPDPDNDVVKDDVRSLLAAAGKDTSRYLKIYINGSIPIVVSLEEPNSTATAAPQKVQRRASSGGRYHIIGGAFSVPSNAEKFVAHLKSLGFDAEIIERKLQMVSYGSFATREEALQALEKIRAAHGDAWLMKI